MRFWHETLPAAQEESVRCNNDQRATALNHFELLLPAFTRSGAMTLCGDD